MNAALSEAPYIIVKCLVVWDGGGFPFLNRGLCTVKIAKALKVKLGFAILKMELTKEKGMEREVKR